MSLGAQLQQVVENLHNSLSYADAVRDFRRAYLLTVLRECRGNQCRAARSLGMHRNTFTRQLAELGIDPWRVRQSVRKRAA